MSKDDVVIEKMHKRVLHLFIVCSTGPAVIVTMNAVPDLEAGVLDVY